MCSPSPLTLSVGLAHPTLFCFFSLCLPFCEFKLSLLAVIIGDDVRQQASGDCLDLMFRDIGLVDEFLSSAHYVSP